MLWFGRTPPGASDASPSDVGADEMEVVGGQARSGPAPMPGSQELDDALAALDALAPPAAAPPATPIAEPGEDEDERWPPSVAAEPSEAPARVDEPELPGEGAGSLTSLTRPSAAPATRAYRRLRRIFPG